MIRTPKRHAAISTAQLNWTLVFLLASVLPFVNDIPLWPLIVAVFTIVWRWWLHAKDKAVPHGVVRFLWTLLNASFVYATFGSFNGLEPGSSLLIIMAAMKLTESVRVRDLLVIIYMSFFLILANFLFDQSPLSAVYSLLLIWLGATSFSQVNRESTQDEPATAFRDSGRLLLQAAPLAVILFVLFPRVPGPFWALPTPSQGQTGLSDSMDIGSISNLLQSSEVAFRVKFADTTPSRSELYWRGPVLEYVNKASWKPSRDRRQKVELQVYGEPLDYEIILEPHYENWLLALDIVNPSQLPPDAKLNYNGSLTSLGNLYERRRLFLSAYTQYALAPTLSATQRVINLDTTLTGNPQARDLAKRWRADSSAPADIIRATLGHFNQQPFVYTLSPPALPTANNKMDDFLFRTRRGFCEHYASAFTLLMRYAGIPARVVTGYMGGEYNPISGYYTIRQSDAHAWAEVWLDGRGWVRIDPTAAVAPERVEEGISGALPLGESLPTFMMNNSSLIRGLRQTLDALNTNWNQWVLGYGQERQWELLRKLGLRTPNTTRLIIVMTVTASLIMALFAAWLGWRSRVQPSDPVHKVYLRFIARLNRLGIETPAYEDADVLAHRVAQLLPEHADAVRNFCATYQKLRYGPEQHPDKNLPRLKLQLGQIPWRPVGLGRS